MKQPVAVLAVCVTALLIDSHGTQAQEIRRLSHPRVSPLSIRELITYQPALSPAAAPPDTVKIDRARLYVAAAAGQVIGAGTGWLVGHLIGADCPDDPDVMCEFPWPDNELASKGGAIAGAFIAPPIAVNLANQRRGTVLRGYVFSGLTAFLLSRIAKKHESVIYAIPPIQMMIVVESEIASTRRRR